MAVTADKVVVELELRDQQYQTRIRGSEREFKRSMDATERAAEEAARDIERTLGGIPDSLRAEYRALGADIGRSFMGISRGAQIAFGAITAYSLKLASDAQEIESAFEVAFGNSTDAAKAFSEQLADTAGRDSVVLRESMTRLQLVLTGTGVAAADAAKMVEALASAGVDAGSLFNTSDAEALQKIISGLTGETEPLKAFGVVITEAAVKAELLRLGFKGNAEAATEAQKSVARTNLILKGLSVAQGDAARTADSASNTTKRMTAEFNKAARDLGTQLLPAMTALFGAATDVLEAFNDLPGGVQVAGLAFLGLIAAGGPIAGLLANLGRVISLARQTKIALAGIGATGAGAGAAGAAGGAAGYAARFAGPLGAIGSVLSLGGDTQRGDTSLAGRVTGALQEEARVRAEIVRLTNEGKSAEAARQRQYLRDVEERRRLSQALLGGQQLAVGVASGMSDAEVGASVLGGFGLGSLAGNGPGGGGGGRSRAGSDAAKQAADELNDLRRDLARVQDDLLTDAEKAAKELAEKTATIRAAAANRLISPQDASRLELESAAIGLTLPEAEELKPLGTEWADQLAEGQRRMMEEQQARYTDYARTFVSALRSDDVWGSLGRIFSDAAAENLSKSLGNLLTQLAGQANDGGGGFLGSVLRFGGSLFGGGRALGGPVRAGWTYDVGENGREKFVAPANGYIIPNTDTVAAKAGGGGGMAFTYAPVYQVSGYGQDIEGLKRQMEADRAGFRNNVAAAVNDGFQRGKIRPGR